MTITELKNKLDEFSLKYETVHLEKNTNDATILSIFNKVYDENYISDYLAFLIKREDENFGKKILEKIMIRLFEEESFFDQCNKIIVMREKSFFNLKRIDLLIIVKYNNGKMKVIGIENKVFSKEHYGQTQIYRENIHRQYGKDNSYLIFLTPSGENAQDAEFKSLSYSDLYKILSEINISCLTNKKIAMLCDDFRKHIEEYIMPNTSEFKITDEIKLYNEYFDPITQIVNNIQNLKEYAVGYLENKFKEQLGNDYIFDFNKNRYYLYFYKKNWKEKYFIHFEILFKNIFREFDFVIHIEPQGDVQNREILLNKFFDNFEKHIDINFNKDNYHYNKEYPERFRCIAAHKQYEIDVKIPFEENFFNAFEEFKFLVEPIDKTLEYLRNNQT